MHIAIGDLHGHNKALSTLLNSLHSKVGIFENHLDAKLQPHVHITFTGDYIDRGENSKTVVETIMELQTNNPDNVHCLMGNHELLALGDLEHAQKIAEDKDPEENFDLYNWTNHGRNGGIKFIMNFGETEAEALKNYAHAMTRDQPLGAWIRKLEAFHLHTTPKGKTILCVHAGIPRNLQNPIKLDEIAEQYKRHMETRTGMLQNAEQKYGPQNPLVGGESLFWDRNLPNSTREQAAKVADDLEVDYIVIGHTPQRNGVPANYGDRIFNIDVGMCPAYGENEPMALLIDDQYGPQAFFAERGVLPIIHPTTPKKTKTGKKDIDLEPG